MRAHVSFAVEVPDDLTDDQVREWVEYHLNARSSMSADLHGRLGDMTVAGSAGICVERDPWPEPLEETR